MQRVLVTGGTGFVAGWAIVELLRRGYRVRTTVRRPEAEPGLRRAFAAQVDPGDGLEFVRADLMDDAGWDAAAEGCAYVLHIASPLGGAGDLIATAREGTLRVLRAAVRPARRRW